MNKDSIARFEAMNAGNELGGNRYVATRNVYLQNRSGKITCNRTFACCAIPVISKGEILEKPIMDDVEEGVLHLKAVKTGLAFYFTRSNLPSFYWIVRQEEENPNGKSN